MTLNRDLIPSLLSMQKVSELDHVTAIKNIRRALYTLKMFGSINLCSMSSVFGDCRFFQFLKKN